MTKELRALKVLSAGLLASVFAAPVIAADVTPERLLNADKEPQNWLMPHKDVQQPSLFWRLRKSTRTTSRT